MIGGLEVGYQLLGAQVTELLDIGECLVVGEMATVTAGTKSCGGGVAEDKTHDKATIGRIVSNAVTDVRTKIRIL